MRQSQSELEELIQSRKERFHVQIRRLQKEQLFQTKRVVVNVNQKMERFTQQGITFGQQNQWDNTTIILKQLLDFILLSNVEDKTFSEKVLKDILLICDNIPFGLYPDMVNVILDLLLTQIIPDSISESIIQQVCYFRDVTQQIKLLQLLHIVTQNSNIHLLIQQKKICEFLIQIYNSSLNLEGLTYFYTIIELLCAPNIGNDQNSYPHLKDLLFTIQGDYYEYKQQIQQLMITLVNTQKRTKDAINTITQFDNFYKKIIEELPNNISIFPIIRGIIENDDFGSIELVDRGLLDLLDQVISIQQMNGEHLNYVYNQVIYILANVFYLKRTEVIMSAVNSELFRTIMALNQKEITIKEFDYIVNMFMGINMSGIEEYQGKEIYYYITLNTDFPYMMKSLLTVTHNQSIVSKSLTVLEEILMKLDQSALQILIQKFKDIQVDIIIDQLSQQYKLRQLETIFSQQF